MQEVSIIPRGHAGGYTLQRPETDDRMMTFGKANDYIAMCMGGRLAEEIIFKDISSGAVSDIKQATKVAHDMVYDWGMSKKIGFMSLGASDMVFIGRDYQAKNDFSEKLAAMADEEIQNILATNYKRGKQILTDNIEILHEMAKLLLARETIYKEEVDMILAGKKTEEIVKIMDERQKQQKIKEEKLRAQKESREKLENFRKKIEDGENFVKMGIITQAELDNLKKDYAEFEKTLNDELEEKPKQSKEKPETAKKSPQEKPTTKKTTSTQKPKTAKKENKNDEEN